MKKMTVSQEVFRNDTGSKTVWDYIFSTYMTMMLDERTNQIAAECSSLASELEKDYHMLNVLYNYVSSVCPYEFTSEWLYNPNKDSDKLLLRTKYGEVDMGIVITGLSNPVNRLSRYGTDDGSYQNWVDNIYQLIRSFHLYCHQLHDLGKCDDLGVGCTISPISGVAVRSGAY